MADDLDILLPVLLGTGVGQNHPTAPGMAGAIGTHQGVVIEWDELSGYNQVQVLGGNIFENLRVLSTSDSIMLTAGDTVTLLKVQSAWFILGRVAAPGAGASLRVRSATANAEGTVSTFHSYPSWVDLSGVPAGPTLTNVYVGSRRMCLVMITAELKSVLTIGKASFAVTGASNIPATDLNAISSGTRVIYYDDFDVELGDTTTVCTATAFAMLTAADGLNEGMNHFTMKYQALQFTNIVNPVELYAFINRRRITVFPL